MIEFNHFLNTFIYYKSLFIVLFTDYFWKFLRSKFFYPRFIKTVRHMFIYINISYNLTFQNLKYDFLIYFILIL